MGERKLLNDKVAIVTGAGSGIGESIAKRYVEEGALILAIDLQAPELDPQDGRVATLSLDVTESDAPARI